MKMKRYFPIFLFVLFLSLIIGIVVWKIFPQYEKLIVTEDGLVENITATLFFITFVAGLFLAPKAGKNKRYIYIFSFLGLLGFLDEISFGSRLITMDLFYIDGQPIDGFHDLLAYPYQYTMKTLLFLKNNPLLLLLIIAVIFTIIYVKFKSLIIKYLTTIKLNDFWYLFGSLFIVVGIAFLIDVELFHFNGSVIFEELLEMNAGLIILLICFSLKELGSKKSYAVE